MATIKFYLRSKNDNSNIYVRFSNGRICDLRKKTGYIINYNDWDSKKNIPKKSTPELKNLKIKLDKLSSYIESNYNESFSRGEVIDDDWLETKLDSFNNQKIHSDLEVFTNYIQNYIDKAPYKQNQQKGVGLSHGRITNLKLFKNTFLRFEKEELKGKKILFEKVDFMLAENFKLWLFKQNFSANYVGKNLDNLKTICNDASKNGIVVSPTIKDLIRIQETKKPEQLITLNPEELKNIWKTTLDKSYLINARKWLLLGCFIGQRGGDLLSINESNIKEIDGVKIIELKQQKTGELVAIPLLPDALKIIEDGFPHKISLTRFNEYIKEVCKLADINNIIIGNVKKTGRNPVVKEKLEKYNFISSHICRRSFATNFYGKFPTSVLMRVTGHKTEKMFLIYIGKTSYDNAFQMHEAYLKLYSQNDLKIIS